MKNTVQLLNIVQLANQRDTSTREAIRAYLNWSITEMLLEERLLLTGLISPDQLCCTQANHGECVAGEDNPPAYVSSFSLRKLSSNLVYVFGSSFVSL